MPTKIDYIRHCTFRYKAQFPFSSNQDPLGVEASEEQPSKSTGYWSDLWELLYPQSGRKKDPMGLPVKNISCITHPNKLFSVKGTKATASLALSNRSPLICGGKVKSHT